MSGQRIILAADELTLDQLLELLPKLAGRLYAVKIHSHYDEHGSGIVGQLGKAGALRVWVDAKLHDIPNTVRLRAEAIARSHASIVSVHASGGIEMMKAAHAGGKMETYAITALTSLSEEDVHLLHGQPSKAAVLALARLARLAEMDGVVCSPKEVGMLSSRPELRRLKFVVPGVRSAGTAAHDQKRVDTPAAAIKAGATHLVIGRQITQASDPLAALQQIEEEIATARQQIEEEIVS